MSKHGGFTDLLVKARLVEDDSAPVVSVHDPEPVQPAPVPVAAFAPIVALSAEDTAQMKALEAQIYAKASSYVSFQRVRESLGANVDLQTVFKVLKAANPSLTLETILSDVDGHLSVITHNREAFDAQIGQARASRIDGVTQQIATLTETNRKAAEDIAARAGQIAQLQTGLNTAAASIADASARFKLVEDQLSAPLLQAKQTLSTLS